MLSTDEITVQKVMKFCRVHNATTKKVQQNIFFTKSEISNSDHGVLEVLFDLLHAFFKVWQSNLDAHFSMFSC